MKNNDSGEFELVLGNRQLLSGFFVVVILFAVFFVMGYIVGRNTSGPARSGDQASMSLPSVSDARPAAASGTPPQPAPAPTQQPAAAPSEPAPSGAQPATQPQTKPAETGAPPPDTTPAEPPPGTYLQVVSVAQHEAEVVAKTLHDKGFPSSLSPGPNGRTRVLVGPYDDVGALGKAKADLENLGFHPIVKK